MLVWYMLSSCLSVCPSVRPSHASIVPKRLNVGSCTQRHMDSSFLLLKIRQNCKGVTRNVSAKQRCGRLKLGIFDQYLAYLRNGASYGRSHYGRLFETRRLLEWCQCLNCRGVGGLNPPSYLLNPPEILSKVYPGGGQC